MNSPHQEAQSSIALLRVKAAGPDLLAARLRAEAVINCLALRTPGLPPEAILCIRRLRDPRPGALRLGPVDLQAALSWERAVNAEVADLARLAARPADGSVPADAQAVVFRSRAELLACMAADWLSGDLLSHWWWNSALHGRSAERAVVESWLETPAAIPSAITRLEEGRLAAPFIRSLPSETVQILTLAVTHTFGLRELHQLASSLRDTLDEIADRSSHQPIQPPWYPFVPAFTTNLPVEGQMLVGLCLTLHRAEPTARSPRFARQVLQWQQAAQQKHTGRHQEQHYRLPDFTGEFEQRPPHDLSAGEGLAENQVPPRNTDGALSPLNVLPIETQPNDVQADYQEAAPAETAGEAVASHHWRSQTDERVVIFTAYGGLLYLINLGLFLGLYGDFTMPLTPGIDLPIWDFIALTGRELVGPAVMSDPLWGLLALLSGRADDQPPGCTFTPPGALSLEDWMAERMQTIRPRLGMALETGEAELPAFFHAQARITVSAERMDAYFSLDELPIAIRIAGLDRDPYWVPAAGKTIAFHYD